MKNDSRETMTSRQRVINSIEHKKTDRMPIDFGVHFSTGISVFAYRNLREHLGLSTDNIEMIDCTQCLARVDNDIAERFHSDTILLNPPYPKIHTWNPRGKYVFKVPESFKPVLCPDGSWTMTENEVTARMPADGFFFDGAWFNYYKVSYEESIELFAKRAEYIAKETDKFTMLMGFTAYFYGLDFACDMITDPEGCIANNERIHENQIKHFDKVNKRYGKFINAIEINSDLGMQGGPLCTPDSYEKVTYPFLKKFCDYVHNNSDIKLFMHSCGSVYKLMDYIVDAGVDALNPVQISAADMDPAQLKAKYGSRICFWGGGCDTQNVLWQASPDEVSKHVKKNIDIFKKDSGFVFNQVHNIMGNVPPENIVAMFDTAYANAF